MTASLDKTARVWDAVTGATLLVLSGHQDLVVSGAFSVDGAFIVTASMDKSARIWNSHTGTLITILTGHGRDVESASYSPDGRRIVTASDDGTARIWDCLLYTSPSDAQKGEDLFDALARRLTTQVGDQEGLSELLGHGQSTESLAAHLRHATAAPGYPVETALGQVTVQALQDVYKRQTLTKKRSAVICLAWTSAGLLTYKPSRPAAVPGRLS